MTKFWTEDLCALFTSLQIFPSEEQSTAEKLNAITRLALLLSVVLLVIGVDWWLYFLLTSVLVIVIIKYATGGSEQTNEREGFARVPRYEDPYMSTTTVDPVFSEEWSLQEPEFSLLDNAPVSEYESKIDPSTGCGSGDCDFEDPVNSSSYPYGQYLTRTNLLPSDERATHSLNGGQTQARSFANSAWLRHDLAHREDLTSTYKRTLARRFRHSSGGVYTPYAKY